MCVHRFIVYLLYVFVLLGGGGGGSSGLVYWNFPFSLVVVTCMLWAHTASVIL